MFTLVAYPFIVYNTIVGVAWDSVYYTYVALAGAYILYILYTTNNINIHFFKKRSSPLNIFLLFTWGVCTVQVPMC